MRKSLQPTFAQLKKATHPVYLATTFDGSINGRHIREAGDLRDVTARGFERYDERFFAIPNTPAVQELYSKLYASKKSKAYKLGKLLEIIKTEPEAKEQEVMIIDGITFAYLSDSSLPKGEYYGWCTAG